MLTGCAARTLQVKDAWARPAPAKAISAVYLMLQNTTNEADALLGATTEAGRAAEIHTSMSTTASGGHDMGIMPTPGR